MKPVILIVLDGLGIAPPGPGNAVYLANPTNINTFLYTYPNTTLKASGEAVGLPFGEVGNTEVGHINLGAGRIVYQDLPRINMSIADGSFFRRPAFLDAIKHIEQTNGNLHLIGLVGQGSVHSEIDHLFALLHLAKEQKVRNVFIHVITDGRDSPPESSIESVNRLEEKTKELGIGRIASVMGRYYAMDRDRRWERIEKAYRCLTLGEAKQAASATDAINQSYAEKTTDEFILPTNIVKDNRAVSLIRKGDSVIFFNYRIDRPRELTKAFVLDDFEAQANLSASYDPYEAKYHKTHLIQSTGVNPPFNRGEKIKDLFFVTMTEYEKNLPVKVAFAQIMVDNPLGRIISDHQWPQLRLTESEKERFVTFYFNGQQENPFPQEERIIIPSPKVPTYDLKPEMAAYEITNSLVSKMKEKKFKFTLVNFPNPDMVGHTGNIQATILGIKAIDDCLGKIVVEALALDYTVLITADHGNAEQKINPQTGNISTEHTSSMVPFIAINNQMQGKFTRLRTGILADVAPTILALLGLSQPEAMTGRNLLEDIALELNLSKAVS